MSPVAVLLALVPLSAPLEPVARAVPNRFIHLEPASLGTIYDADAPNSTTPRVLSIRVLKLSCSLGRARFGFAPVEAGAFMGHGHPATGTGGALPLFLGFDLFRNPKRTLLCYSMVPDVYLEGAWFPIPVVPGQPLLRFTVNAEVEYYGLGIGLEAGYLTANEQDLGRVHIFGAGFRLRLLPGNFGF